MNKIIKNFLALSIILVGTFSYAQTQQEYNDLVKSAIKVELKNYVYNGLELTEEEEKAFDPVFNRYLKAQSELAMDKIVQLDQYLDLKDNYSKESLDKLNQKIWKTSIAQEKLNEKYYKKFKKAIGVEKTTAFFLMLRVINNQLEAQKIKLLIQ